MCEGPDDADIVLGMSIEPVTRTEVMAGALERIARTRELARHDSVQVDGGVDNENVRPIYGPGARH